MRLEIAHKRRRHQSLMQLQALVDDVRPPADPQAEGTLLSRHLGIAIEDAATETPPGDRPSAVLGTGVTCDHASSATTSAPGSSAAAAVSEAELMSGARMAARIRCFWATALGPRWQVMPFFESSDCMAVWHALPTVRRVLMWQVGAELARALATLGLLAEASTLFRDLELWEELVTAITALGKPTEAEELVRARLDVAPTAAMWIQLGELTKDATCFHTAWKVSGGACARAKLRLGSHFMQREKWSEARKHLQAALRVKAHYAEAWYCCAVCLLKLGDTDTALGEMRKVVVLDPSHHQAWSALGGLFAKKRMKREALYAFREACKLCGNSSDLWMHSGLAALDLGRFEETVYAAGMSLKLGGSPAPQISSLLAQAFARDTQPYARWRGMVTWCA